MTTVTSPAQERVSEIEQQINDLKQQLQAARGQVEPEPVEDHALLDSRGKQIPLSEWFGDRDEMIVVHNMGRSCTYCTLWADGFDGLLAHLEDRAAFLVVNPDRPEVQREFAASRGWRFDMASSANSGFGPALGFGGNDNPQPGVSVLRRTPDGAIERVSRSSFGPGDNFCPVWDLFAMLPGGAGEWAPKLTY